MTEAELTRIDAIYIAFCKENDIVMDSDETLADYAARGHLYSEPSA